MDENLKICKLCKKSKNINDFYKCEVAKNKIYNECKECKKIINKNRYEKNKKKLFNCEVCGLLMKNYLKEYHLSTKKHKLNNEINNMKNLTELLLNIT